MKTTSVTVRLSPEEAAIIDEHRGNATRSAFLRSLIRQGPAPRPAVASRDEALVILTELARDGKVAAAIALERALRLDQPVEEVPEWMR